MLRKSELVSQKHVLIVPCTRSDNYGFTRDCFLLLSSLRNQLKIAQTYFQTRYYHSDEEENKCTNEI